MVTQQVVLLSQTSEQVDPSTTNPPPPPALPYPHRTPDQPPPQPPTVSVLDHQSYLPWDYSLVTAYLVRGLPSWQVRCAA